MTVDVQESFLIYLYNAITSDNTLKSLMGGSVSLYPVWAKTDADFPYLVHRFDLRPRGEPYPFAAAVYYLDIWDHDPSSETTLDIRKRIVELIDELQFATTEIANAKIRIQSDGFVPESEDDIWHYAMQFNIDYYRKSETAYILNR